jgi:sodium/potassium/calcium exchanger 6
LFVNNKSSFLKPEFHNKNDRISVFRRRITENNLNARKPTPTVCTGLDNHKGYATKCEYIIAYPECGSGGFLNYIVFFYCDCGKVSFLGYLVLGIWLVALIYMLSNNAADYFCCSLEKLSNLLKLPPTVAGVALLPLGNGAPDVFASIAAFVGSDSGEVGLNSVLGGAIFVCCIVVGAVSIKVSDHAVRIDRTCFIRDVCFFLFVVVSLLVVIIIGEIGLIGSIAFVGIYLVYAVFVAGTEFFRQHKGLKTPLLPVKEEEEALFVSLLDDGGTPHLQKQFPHWLWTSHVAMYSNLPVKEDHEKILWGWNEEETPNSGDNNHSSFSFSKFCSKFFMYLELPLTIPRRLTIPIVEEDRWSKGYAVATATLAPTLLAFLWNTQDSITALNGGISYLIGAIIGITLGVLAFVFTKFDHPPQKFLFPWVFGGFFMSIVWFYIIANELVSVLQALGLIFAINPSLLGLTVLAWGNSMGDLVSNLALASNGGDDVQIAMSGCYAGPIFNILAGLGIPMLLGSVSKSPSTYVLPKDSSLYYTMGFLILGLVWSLVMLPRNKMQPNKALGMGLITIYSVFLCCRASFAVGMWSTDI